MLTNSPFIFNVENQNSIQISVMVMSLIPALDFEQ